MQLHKLITLQEKYFEEGSLSKEFELNKSKVINKVIFLVTFFVLSDDGDPLLKLKCYPWALSRRKIKSQIVDHCSIIATFGDFMRKRKSSISYVIQKYYYFII